jgi:hypothetical protein
VSDHEYALLLKRLDRLNDESVVIYAETRRLIEYSSAVRLASLKVDSKIMLSAEIKVGRSPFQTRPLKAN